MEINIGTRYYSFIPTVKTCGQHYYDKVMLIFIRIDIFNYFSQFVVKVAYFDKIYTSYTTYKIWIFCMCLWSKVYEINSLTFAVDCRLFCTMKIKYFFLALYLVLWSNWFKREIFRLLIITRVVEKNMQFFKWMISKTKKKTNHTRFLLFQLIMYWHVYHSNRHHLM